MDDLPPPVSLDGIPLPPLPDQPYSNAATKEDSPQKNITRQEVSGTKIDKDESSAESAHEATCSTGIKRPLNRFFLYKVWAQPHYVKAYPGLSNQVISKMISRDWHNRSDHVKDHFAQLAVWEKAKHVQQYPNYKYQPKTNRSLKRKIDKRREKTEKPMPESAKPPMQNAHSPAPKSVYHNVDPRAYPMNPPAQFGNFSMQNQYDLYGNPNDRPVYPELPKTIPLSPDGVNRYLQQMDMELVSRAHARKPPQLQQSDMQAFHAANWHASSRGPHVSYSEHVHPSKNSMELHHNSVAAFPTSQADPNPKLLFAYHPQYDNQYDPAGHIRSSEYLNLSNSSGSEPPDFSDISEACMGDAEDDDDNTTMYDDEIESLQRRLLELRRLKNNKAQRKARRQMADRRRSSNSSNSSTMSESNTRHGRDNSTKQEVIMELGNMFHSPPSAIPPDAYRRESSAPLPLGGSQYTQEHPYSTDPKSNSMDPSESSFNFYDSLSPLSNTISAYLSNAISAEDTTGFLSQLIGDEPVDHHPIINHQRNATGPTIPGDFSSAIALLRNVKREAVTDSEDDGKRL